MFSLRNLSLLLVCFTLIQGLAQPGRIYYEDTPQDRGRFSVAAADQIPLFANPGENSQVVTLIFFTEELEHKGEEAFVKSDRSNYVYVETADGNLGWVDDRFLVRNGGPAVMLNSAPIFDKPSTYSTATGLRFGAGELIILSDWQDNWVYLTGENKRKFGWVEGYQLLSTNTQDIEIGGQIRRAMLIPEEEDRVIALRSIGSTPQFMGSPLRDVVRDLALRMEQGDRPSEGEVYITDAGSLEPLPPGQGQGEGIPGGTVQTETDRSGTTVKVITDAQTGQVYRMIEERGSIQPVEAKDPADIYYCYHKSVPVGQKVLLELPYAMADGRKYLPLTVMAPLRSTNPNVVGLGPELIKKVFGVSQASEAPEVTIAYPEQ